MEFILFGLAVFALILRVGLWAIRTLDSHEAQRDKAMRAKTMGVIYSGPIYSNHGREIR